MWGVEEMGASVVEHCTPTGCGGRNAEAEKAHCGFGENGSGHSDGGLHDDGLDDVGKNVHQNDAGIACAEGAGGFHEFPFARGQHLRPDEAGIANPASEGERENQIENTRAAEGDECDGDENRWERHEGVHDHDVDETVQTSAVISCERADDETDAERCGDDRAAYEHGNLRAIDEAGEDVAAEFIGAAPVSGGGRREPRGKINVGGVLGRDPGSKEGEKREHDHQYNADGRERIAAGGTGQRDGEGGHGYCRILGLAIEYMRSVRKFTAIYVKPIARMQPCTR